MVEFWHHAKSDSDLSIWINVYHALECTAYHFPTASPYTVPPAQSPHPSSSATNPPAATHFMCTRHSSVFGIQSSLIKWCRKDFHSDSDPGASQLDPSGLLHPILVEETQQAPPCQDFGMEIADCIFRLCLCKAWQKNKNNSYLVQCYLLGTWYPVQPSKHPEIIRRFLKLTMKFPYCASFRNLVPTPKDTTKSS